MDVVAALIERNGTLLICQRKAGQRHAGKWEFPGGKVEVDEDFRSALARPRSERAKKVDYRALAGLSS